MIFTLLCIWLERFEVYLYTDLPTAYFGEEEDNITNVRLMRNIIWHIKDDSFHLDYLLAAITALLWFRFIILLKLSEHFGPTIEMIFAMMELLTKFMVLLILQLVLFSCIAALTLSDNPNFANISAAILTYLNSALGEFDLEQYDDYKGFKRWFGLGLHILVLFANMILLINLLIALMSD